MIVIHAPIAVSFILRKMINDDHLIPLHKMVLVVIKISPFVSDRSAWILLLDKHGSSREEYFCYSLVTLIVLVYHRLEGDTDFADQASLFLCYFSEHVQVLIDLNLI